MKECKKEVCLIPTQTTQNITIDLLSKPPITGQVGLGVGSWPSNRATEGSNSK